MMKRNLKSKVIMAVVVAFVLSIALSSQSLGGLKLKTPQQISPRNNSHFTHYPRTLTLRWGAVKGAISYDVEIDCLHCRQVGQWDSQNGPAWIVASDIKTTNYSFTFVGDNKGRWRVRASRGALKSSWSPWWYFDFKTGGSASGTTKKLPDLIVRDIRLIENCKIQVTIANIGTAGVPASYYDLPDAVAVQMYKGSQAWGGMILKMFDPVGKLQAPGGIATHVWFSDAANLNLSAGTHSLKVTVDNGGVLTELSETNNSLTKRVTCKKMLSTMPGQVVTTIPQLAKAPETLILDFTDAYLVFVNPSKSIQIAAQNTVLSYGSDWEKCQLKPFLYHIRQNFWKSFYWKVNTSKKEVYEVTGGTFCKLAGSEKKLNIKVDVVGGSDTIPPDRFFLRFSEARLVYKVSTKILQLATGDKVLSYCQDFQKCNLTASVYHFKENFWQGFHWKVDTLQKKVWKVTGTFCQPDTGGTLLNIGVRVFN
jgi:hypothetical protein